MKKTLAFILVCALLVSAFTLTAFADTANLVGDHNNGTGVGEGDAWPTAPQGSGNINVTVDTVVHNYAADVTYTIPVYELPQITWDVQNLNYKVEDIDPANTINGSKVTFVVTNYSDLAIDSEVTYTDKDDEDGIDFAWSNVGVTVNDNEASAPIAAVAYQNNNASGDAVSVTYTLNVTNNDVVKTVLHYENAVDADGNDVNGTQVVIATYTVIVSN